MPDVFISYARKQRARAEIVKRALEQANYTVFFDIDDIDGGDMFPSVIDRAVKSATVVVGCWSPLAFERPWVMQECRVARARNVLIPVIIERWEEMAPPTDFFGVHAVDLSDFSGDQSHEGWRALIRAIEKKRTTATDRPIEQSSTFDRSRFDSALRQFTSASDALHAEFHLKTKDYGSWGQESEVAAAAFEGFARRFLAEVPPFKSQADVSASNDVLVAAFGRTFLYWDGPDRQKDVMVIAFAAILPMQGDPIDRAIMDVDQSSGVSDVKFCARPGLLRVEGAGSRTSSHRRTIVHRPAVVANN